MSRKLNLPTVAAIALMCIALTFVITYSEYDRISPALSGYQSIIDDYKDQASKNEEKLGSLQSKLDEVSKYFELKDVIDTYYVGDYDQNELKDMMAAGVVAGIGDKWSYYLPAADYEDYLLSNENIYNGIGVTITGEEELGGFEIVRVAENSPARDAGFQVADIIVAVDGTSVIGETVDAVKAMVKGKTGTEVTLTVTRDGRELDITATRGTVSYDIVKTELLNGDIGYIKLYNFEGNSADAFIGAVSDLIDQGARGFVFDVRNNPGGLMDQLLDIVDYLLPEGETFIQKSVTGQQWVYTSDDRSVDLPMAVLVNENSYSAAEYFAAIFQEFGKAEIIGAKTTGKGYYQVPIELSDGSAVVLSVGEYFTPSGRSLAETGVTPDYEVEMDDESYAKLYYDQLDMKDDSQLQLALSRVRQAAD